MNNSEAGPSRTHKTSLKRLPKDWKAPLNTAISQDQPDIFLTAVSFTITSGQTLSSQEIQTLLYLALRSKNLSTQALNILYDLLDRSSPSYFGGYIPHFTRERYDDAPSWLVSFNQNDETYRLSPLQKNVVRLMKKGIKEGVWGLLWDEMEIKRDYHEADVSMDDQEDEDEEEDERIEDKGKKVISENGWRVLRWLLDVWEKDQDEHTLDHPDQPWSPLFLLQLPAPLSLDLQIDRADQVIFICHEDASEDQGDCTATSIKNKCRSRLLTFLIKTVMYPKSPFLPSSMRQISLRFIRDSSLSHLRLLLSTLPDSFCPIISHLLVLAIEQLANQPKRNTFQAPSFVVGKEKKTNFPAPSTELIRDVLLLRAHRSADVEKCNGFKELIVGQFDPSWISDFGWAEDEDWRRRFKEAVEGEDGDNEALLDLIDMHRTVSI